MTDKEKLLKLFDEIGVKYTASNYIVNIDWQSLSSCEDFMENEEVVEVHFNDKGKFECFLGFGKYPF